MRDRNIMEQMLDLDAQMCDLDAHPKLECMVYWKLNHTAICMDRHLKTLEIFKRMAELPGGKFKRFKNRGGPSNHQ